MSPDPQAMTGREAPLGATAADDGVNFALFSAHAEKVELCLFDAQGETELRRLPLRRGSEDIWSVFVPGLKPGARYGYRVHGPYDPDRGHRFNPNKLLIDPYARRLDRRLTLADSLYGYAREGGDHRSFDPRDSAASMPKCIVETERPVRPSPLRRKPDPVIYEAHLRGLTRLHPTLPEKERGTFAGLAAAPVISYLQQLGIDAIELMPVQFGADESALQRRGLSNYWGYNTVAFMAPARHYLAGDTLDEICAAVDALHAAGIEVILDVAFNHSGEGDEFGPTLCFRGLDNHSYYRLHTEDPARYINDTGCGNTLNLGHPQVLRLVMDSLRYWAARIGVDGFRFDLASTLARDEDGFNPRSGFFAVLQQDPVLSQLRLIAEPWDVGHGGYQLGHFPRGWLEWNDRYRDSVRRFWRGDRDQLGEFARRLHGSGDLFEHDRRRPQASVNFVTCHDGYTLTDLVSYEQRHNEANGEDNRDGHRENFSCNHGIEGPSGDARISALRTRQRRNLLATLLLSQGTPMLLCGDEVGRSQQGNNNAYCQDNALNWFPWEALDDERTEFLRFTRDLIALRRRYPLLRWPDFLHGAGKPGARAQCHWLHPQGRSMTAGDWHAGAAHCLGMLLSAAGVPSPALELLLLTNADARPIDFRLPERPHPGHWLLALDTSADDWRPERVLDQAAAFTLEAHSLCLLVYRGAAATRGEGQRSLTDEQSLAALADACGIAAEFRDFRDQPVETPLPVRARVLARMGICNDEIGTDPQRALAAVEADAWSRVLPATRVVTADLSLTLPLRLPGEKMACALTLAITAEDGMQKRITLDAADSPVLATHAAGAGTLELREVTVPQALAPGYYRAELFCDGYTGALGDTTLIVTPPQAYRPPALHKGERLFGFSVQLYTLRSARNWGIGDFTDLSELIRVAAAQGADIIGISPLHALFPANPLHISPYSPSNRAFLNVLYIDPEAIPDFAACDEAGSLLADAGFRRELQRLRDAHRVDYAGVAAAKKPVLEMLYRRFRSAELAVNSPRARAFRQFVDRGGEHLFLHALFDCLHEHFLAINPDRWGWPVWPEAYRDPRGAAAQDFARREVERLEFFLYLQWCAEQQLANAQALAKALGMATGIYLDLAVGVDLAGSEVWSNQASFAVDASAGAPPDELARSGQDWGFPPLCPRQLEASSYALFIRNIRASMARAGAVRYDHAVSLERLWWIPDPGDAARGAFVHYDLDALLGLLALESQREECLVIGEDLGTLPPRLRECMARRHIFSYKVLYFEKQDGRMRLPDEYPHEATATITTHDLATLASWWEGSDIELRAGLGLLGTAAVAEQLREERAHDRRQLLLALQDQADWQGSVEPTDIPAMHSGLSGSIHRFLARSNAAVMLTQLEDLMEMRRPVNVPGTSVEHPNWQRKLRWPLEGLFARSGVREICAAIREGRGKSDRGPTAPD